MTLIGGQPTSGSGSISTEIVCGDRRAMSGMGLKADVMSDAALGDGRGTSGLGLAFRLLAIRVNRARVLCHPCQPCF
jgi:hypothetical protein